MAADTAPIGADAVRVVEVSPPSVADETRLVVVAVLQIAFWSAIVIGAEYGAAHRDGAGAARVTVNYDEIAFAAMPAEDQRLFGLIHEGLIAAEQDRNQSKTWPTVEALARRLVPPFAPDPIDRGGYRWTRCWVLR